MAQLCLKVVCGRLVLIATGAGIAQLALKRFRVRRVMVAEMSDMASKLPHRIEVYPEALSTTPRLAQGGFARGELSVELGDAPILIEALPACPATACGIGRGGGMAASSLRIGVGWSALS